MDALGGIVLFHKKGEDKDVRLVLQHRNVAEGWTFPILETKEENLDRLRALILEGLGHHCRLEVLSDVGKDVWYHPSFLFSTGGPAKAKVIVFRGECEELEDLGHFKGFELGEAMEVLRSDEERRALSIVCDQIKLIIAPFKAGSKRALPPEVSADRRDLLPVTVLSGFLGAGKTTLLQRILVENTGRRIAVLVNDMSEVNIDEVLVRGGGVVEVTKRAEEVVALSNGCICCTLREDLLEEVGKIAKKGIYDYLVIESTGISEPRPVAETFTFRNKEGESLSDFARLDTMVTVIDASSFLDDFKSSDSLSTRGLAVSDKDPRSIVDLIRDQLEFANIILVNKVDLVPSSETTSSIISRIRAFNSEAQIYPTTRSNIPLDRILNTGLFSFAKAARSALWLKELRGEHVPETVEYGISSFVLKSRRPFHPQRLFDMLYRSTALQGVYRAKGFVWFATRPQVGGLWEQAGRQVNLVRAGPWLAAIPVEAWPPGATKKMRAPWHAQWGDRQNEVVFIGQVDQLERIQHAMESCLLNDHEMEHPESWSTIPDPFGPWPPPRGLPTLEDAQWETQNQKALERIKLEQN